jgi:predicted Zn-dependent protease with MMP-like domain
LVLDIVTDLDERWSDRLGLVEYAVEDTPQLPDDWESGTVPLSTLVRGSGATPTRLVVFRRPLEHRAADRVELEAMVLTVVVEQVAELLGIPPSEVDPRYPDDLD